MKPKIKELPITFRLPKTGDRDEFFGLSRSWYYNAESSGAFKLIHPATTGKDRGVTLVKSCEMIDLLFK